MGKELWKEEKVRECSCGSQVFGLNKDKTKALCRGCQKVYTMQELNKLPAKTERGNKC